MWLYGCSCTSSGAMYSGVPLMEVSTMVLQLMARAKPAPGGGALRGLRTALVEAGRSTGQTSGSASKRTASWR